MKIFFAAAIISALLAPPSYAQGVPTGPLAVPPSAEEKAEAARKKADAEETEKAYQATVNRTRDADRKPVDPWGDVRQAGPPGKN